jgi:hypothetical protein
LIRDWHWHHNADGGVHRQLSLPWRAAVPSCTSNLGTSSLFALLPYFAFTFPVILMPRCVSSSSIDIDLECRQHDNTLTTFNPHDDLA